MISQSDSGGVLARVISRLHDRRLLPCRLVDERISQLLDLGYRTVPAAEANEAIAQARHEAAESGAAHARPLRSDDAPPALSRSYELILDPDSDWEDFAENALPRLVYHLESVGARAGDVVRRAAELTGISDEELFRRHGTGESRTAQREPPLALPGGDPER